jgi:cell division topological specificity factor MinE
MTTIARATTNGTTVDLNEAPETFWGKMKAAYRIFFPPSAEETARQEAKKRLRMILVADRCAMSETSMDEMKRKIVEAVGEFVDLDETQDVDVSMNTDVELGTMYAVSIPVRRVKAEYDAENDAYMVGAQFVGDGDEDFNYDDSVWEN